MTQVLDKSRWTNGKVQRQIAQGLELGCKGHQTATTLSEKKRLYAHTVPGCKESLLLPVPNCKGKHAVQVFKTTRTIGDVSGQQDLSISFCSKTNSTFFQICTELQIVIYFTIEDQNIAAVWVLHRLDAACNIYNGKAAVPQDHTRFLPEAFSVRTAVYQTVGHALHCRRKINSALIIIIN